MTAIRAANLTLSFLLELGMLAALTYWGFTTGGGVWTSVVLGIAAPVAVVIIWGIFMAPKAIARIREPWHTVVALLLFGVAAAALYVAGHPSLALAFGVLVVLNETLKHLLYRQSTDGGRI